MSWKRRSILNLVKKNILHIENFINILICLALISLSSCKSLDMTRYQDIVLEASKPDDSSFSITFLGNTNFLLDDGTTTILTDGYFSRNGLFKSIFRAEPDIAILQSYIDKFDLGNLDYIIPLHHHFDHVMDAPALSQLTGAKVLGTTNTLNVLKGWSAKVAPSTPINFQQLNLGHTDDVFIEQLGEFNLTFIRSTHMQNDLAKGDIKKPISTPTSARAYKTGDVWILLVTHETRSGKILIVGSAGNVPAYIENSDERSNIDIAFIAVPGLAKKKESDQRDFLEGFVAKISPKLVVPVHWDDLFSYKSGSSDFFELKPQNAIINTFSRTQEGIELICNTAAENIGIDIAIFQFGIAYAANKTASSKFEGLCVSDYP